VRRLSPLECRGKKAIAAMAVRPESQTLAAVKIDTLSRQQLAAGER
jgi:hypothetical protein